MRLGARLGIDVGSVRVGLAASDPAGLLATPVATLPRDAESGGDLDAIAAEAGRRGVVEVVVGLPLSLSGREGPAATTARSYAVQLARRLAPVPVRLVDERLTSVEAHSRLRRGGVTERARRGIVDQEAAVLILQVALDAERATGRPPGEPVTAGASGASGGSGAARGRSGVPGPAGSDPGPRKGRVRHRQRPSARAERDGGDAGG